MSLKLSKDAHILDLIAEYKPIWYFFKCINTIDHQSVGICLDLYHGKTDTLTARSTTKLSTVLTNLLEHVIINYYMSYTDVTKEYVLIAN